MKGHAVVSNATVNTDAVIVFAAVANSHYVGVMMFVPVRK
jgi:hypothetical protein